MTFIVLNDENLQKKPISTILFVIMFSEPDIAFCELIKFITVNSALSIKPSSPM